MSEINGMTVLSKERINGMSLGSLKKYLESVKYVRRNLWRLNKWICCDICNEVIEVTREYTEEEQQQVRTVDWLYHEIKRSKIEKKNEQPKRKKERCRRRNVQRR